MDPAVLRQNAKKLFFEGKGILAADGREPSVKKRFENVGIEYSLEKNIEFRELLFTTPGIEEYISGVILNEDSVEKFASILQSKGILIGVKVDKGVVDLSNFPDEKVTEGIDGLEERLKKFSIMGAKFAKWRAVFSADNGKPSQVCIKSNCDLMARYSAICQSAGIVPIVEPEILMDGEHNIDQTVEATVKTLKTLFNYMFDYKIIMNASVLKINMAVPAKSLQIPDPETVSTKTLEMLHAGASVGLCGIVFLSGGQDFQTATNNLAAICQKHNGKPWPLTFSFERALQEPALKIWQGKNENISQAQQVFLETAKQNSLAVK